MWVPLVKKTTLSIVRWCAFVPSQPVLLFNFYPLALALMMFPFFLLTSVNYSSNTFITIFLFLRSTWYSIHFTPLHSLYFTSSVYVNLSCGCYVCIYHCVTTVSDDIYDTNTDHKNHFSTCGTTRPLIKSRLFISH